MKHWRSWGAAAAISPIGKTFFVFPSRQYNMGDNALAAAAVAIVDAKRNPKAGLKAGFVASGFEHCVATCTSSLWTKNLSVREYS